MLLLGGRDKGASCLQPNPERFYILREKQGRRGTNKERKGKLEQEREKRKKEGLKQNTIQHLGNPGKVQREFIPRKPSLKEILITSNP